MTIARIVKTRGIHGEVAAVLLTDFPERFEGLEKVTLCLGTRTWEEKLESYWFHGDRIILKFRGRERPHEVEELIGCELRVPAADRHAAPEGSFFDDDLAGCEIVEGERRLGTVSGIYRAGGDVHNLVVSRPDGLEFMVPFVEPFIEDIDLAGRRIRVRLPEGLIEATSSRTSRPEVGGDEE